MKQQRTHRQRDFAPLQDKTLSNVLRHLFVTEFGYDNKVLFAEAMIQRILETLDAFVKPAAMLEPGQLLWMAVVRDGHKHAPQAMKETPQVPVVLDLLTDDDLQALSDLYVGRLRIHGVSTVSGEGLDTLATHVWRLLDVIRVYTRKPGVRQELSDPFTLPAGSTVEDLARSIHRELPDRLKFARIWGDERYAGQQVHRTEVLHDRDIVELHE